MRTALRSLAYLSVVALSAVAPLGAAEAASIHFEVTDLPDVNPGEDLWRYAYSLDPAGTPFSAGVTGFAITFDETLYTALAAVTASLDWDILVLQPDLGIPDPGLYDGLALVDSPDLSTPFEVDFVWLGSGTPGSQPFEIYELETPIYGTPVTIESGVTVPVPEPALAALALAAVLGLAVTGARR
jgi:hypothetical protein